MSNTPQPVSPTPPTETPPGCLIQGLTFLLILWALFVPLIVQTSVVQAVWFGDLSKVAYTPQQVLPLSYIHPALVALVAIGLLFRSPRHRAIVQTLLVSAGCAALLLLPRVLLPPASVYASELARIVIELICAALLLLLAKRRGILQIGSGSATALLCVGLFALPWVRYGALGDRIDIVLALAEGLSLGLLAAGILGGILIPGLRSRPSTAGWDLFLGGSALLAALVGIAGAIGQDDVQALMMPVLAGAAFPAMAMALPDRNGRNGLLAPFLLVGLVAALPLLFADPREVALVVSLSDDTYKFTQQAAFWTTLIGLLIWGVFQAMPRRLPTLGPAPVMAAIAALSLVGAGVAYATSSQVGLYGNHAFVILKEQADLSGAARISDVTERRRFVYKTLVDQANRSQAGLRQLLDQRGVAYTSFYLVNAIEVNGDVLIQQEIAQRPEVDRVIFSQALRPLPEPLPLEKGNEAAPSDVSWGVGAINADRVWKELGVRGKGIVIGQSDSGVDWTHPALRNAYRGKDGQHDYNWFDPWTGSKEPWDGNGHGTHTIGTVIGANGIGVAPDAQWFGCANLVRNIGNPPDYLHCMQFMLAPFPLGGNPLRDGDPARAADISTNSWGCPPIEGCDQSSLLAAVKALRSAGIFFAASAGNDGSACDSLGTPPGNYASVISVGAIDSGGDLADFSSRGPITNSADGRTAPTILAPGVNVLSAWPGGGYNSTSGTSMAAPHVAGVVALIWSANPKLRGDVDATEKILIETAQPYNGTRTGCGGNGSLPDPESGYGIIDAYAAVQRAIEMK
jgi:subtilisin family serine protease